MRLCERHKLPAPEVNVRLGPRIVDFLWREQRVVVETDGYRYHRGSQAFEDDHDRDLDLRTLGYDVVRLTYRQVTSTPSEPSRQSPTHCRTRRPPIPKQFIYRSACERGPGTPPHSPDWQDPRGRPRWLLGQRRKTFGGVPGPRPQRPKAVDRARRPARRRARRDDRGRAAQRRGTSAGSLQGC
jgi:Protein of unknown function (DUF559)